MQQFLTKCAAGGTVNLGFIGGSVTAGASATTDAARYTNRFSNFLSSQFSDAQFSVSSAGRAMTTSRFACSRVAEDLLAAFPDLIVLEFAVDDDAADSAGTVGAMEGLVRQCLAYGPDVPVIMMAAMDTSGSGVNQRYHEYVAAHYQIPLISFRDACKPLLDNATLAQADLFGTGAYPNDNGHLICGYLLYDYVSRCYESMLRGQTAAAVAMPAPLLTDRYQFAGMYASNDTTIKVVDAGGWNSVNQENSRLGFFSRHARDSAVISTSAREIVIMCQYEPAQSLINVYDNGALVQTIDNNFAGGAAGRMMQFRIYLDSQSQSHTVAIAHADRFDFTIEYILYAR
jgi:hypothetical protein